MSYAGVDYDDGWYRDKAENRARAAEAKVRAVQQLLDAWEHDQPVHVHGDECGSPDCARCWYLDIQRALEATS